MEQLSVISLTHRARRILISRKERDGFLSALGAGLRLTSLWRCGYQTAVGGGALALAVDVSGKMTESCLVAPGAVVKYSCGEKTI